MAELEPSLRGLVGEREFKAVELYVRGIEPGVVAQIAGFPDASQMRAGLGRAYHRLGVHDLLGASKRLIESGDLDVKKSAQGKSVKAFATLGGKELAIAREVWEVPAEQVVNLDDIGAKTGLTPYTVESYIHTRINPVIGASSRLEMAIAFRAYQDLLAQGYRAPEVNRRGMQIISWQARGIPFKEIAPLLGLNPRSNQVALRVYNRLGLEGKLAPFRGVVRLVEELDLDVNEFIDGRDLSRFRFVSEDEREILEQLTQGRVPANENGKRPGYRICQTLKKDFAAFNANHLATLFYAYKETDPLERWKVIRAKMEDKIEPALTGQVLTPVQCNIFKMLAGGFNVDETLKALGLKETTYRRAVREAFRVLGIDKESKDSQILVVNKLIEAGELDTKELSSGYDLTVFDKFSERQIAVLASLSRGESIRSVGARYAPDAKNPGNAVMQLMSDIGREAGSGSRLQTTVLYRAYQGLLAQGYIPEGITDMRNNAIELLEEYAQGIAPAKAAESREYSGGYARLLLENLYKSEGVSDARGALMRLVASGEVDLKKLAVDFVISKFDNLTAGELIVSDLITKGISRDGIGAMWGLGRTAITNYYVTEIYHKTGIRNVPQLASLFHLYNHPRGFKEAAKNIDQPDGLDIVGIQILRLSLKGMNQVGIGKVLRLPDEQIEIHKQQVFAALGAGENLGALIKLFRTGRIEAASITNGYDIADFDSLEKSEIGVLEALVCDDPRPGIKYIDKVAHYLQASNKEAEEEIKEVRDGVGIRSNEKLAVLYLEYRRRKEMGLEI